MGTNTRLPGMEHIPEAQYKIIKAKEKAKYRNMINAMCPSKELRFAAKEISATDSKCDMCAYRATNCYEGCRVPYPDKYIEALEIDICSEGVLVYLSAQTERQEEDSGITLDDVDELIESAYSTIYVNLKTVAALCGVIVGITQKKKVISLELMSNMYAMLDATQEIIENWEQDIEDNGDDCDYESDYDED